MVNPLSTEDNIITAAKTVFVRKGFDGARMQEIADEAGINKALLHYYFRSKDKLFEKVFDEVFQEVFNTIAESLIHATGFDQFLETFIRNYIDILKNKPYLPQFVLHELNRNPGRMVELLKGSNFDRERLFDLIRQAGIKGVINRQDPIHLVTNILSLCVFPFVARPIITGFMMEGDENAFRQYLDERPDQVLSFVKSAILPGKKGVAS